MCEKWLRVSFACLFLFALNIKRDELVWNIKTIILALHNSRIMYGLYEKREVL